jgi:hypothetical protein
MAPIRQRSHPDSNVVRNRIHLVVAIAAMALALVLPTQAYSAQARSLDRVSARSFAVYRMLGNDMWPLQEILRP